MATPDAMPLTEVSRLVGALAWWEGRCFEILGRWSAAEEDADARILFATHSRHHGDRYGWWVARLPEAKGFDIEDLVRPEDDVDALDAVGELKGTEERLEVAARVLIPGLRSRVDRLRARCRTHCDGELVRTLRLVDADLAAHAEEIDRRLRMT